MRAAVAALVAVLLAGCGGSTPPAAPTPVREELERNLEVTIGGARKHALRARQSMVFLTREASGGDPQLSAVGLNPTKALVDGDTSLNPEVGLVGAYRGDGTYEIPAGTGSPVPTTGPTVSPTAVVQGSYNVAVTFVDASPRPRDQRFAYLLEPCRLTLRSKATEGSISCPALVAANGDKISFAMTWGP